MGSVVETPFMHTTLLKFLSVTLHGGSKHERGIDDNMLYIIFHQNKGTLWIRGGLDPPGGAFICLFSF